MKIQTTIKCLALAVLAVCMALADDPFDRLREAANRRRIIAQQSLADGRVVQTILRNADGTVVVAKDGAPYYESEKNVYKDSNWLTKREERDLSVKANADGSYEAALGSRVNDVSSNGIAMVTGSINATTQLVTAVADAYVKISGGASADVTSTVVSKIISAFKSGGGDTDKATVTSTDTTVTVTDGTTCTTCSPDGTCTTGKCSE